MELDDHQKIIALQEGLRNRSQKMVEYQINQPFYFIMKLQEEIGEVSGAYVKLLRGFNLRDFKKMISKMEPEMNLNDLSALRREELAEELRLKWYNKKHLDIKLELADTFMMLLQVAEKFGVDYSTLLNISIEKFNQVNKELGEDYTQFNINTNG